MLPHVAQQRVDLAAAEAAHARSEAADNPGYLFDHIAGIGLAGDWLAGGRVEGAWESASQLVQAMGQSSDQ